MFFEISVLQQFSGINLNRDDTNLLKTIDFGGFKRQRVSSQCWKNAIRKHDEFFSNINYDHGIRTKKMASEIFNLAGKEFDTEKNRKSVNEFLKNVGLGEMEVQRKQKNKGPTLFEAENNEFDKLKTLFFTSEKELALATQILKKQNFDPVSSAKEFNKERLNFPLAPDISLFGRMAASEVTLNVESAVQFAHAISTNEILIEDDFYTALDDLANSAERADAGASMMGYTQIASPCFYRYACISMETLFKNLNNDKELTLKCVNSFIETFVNAIPTGKKNSTAPSTYPDSVLISYSKKQPINLVNAFLKPVRMERHSKISLAEKSSFQLFEYLEKLNDLFEWEKERKNICYSLFAEALNIKQEKSSLKIPIVGSKFSENLNQFLKENIWSK
ncbi:type I-E CRISPR-associated protein Cas7/Cse4/CasC [Silvanigrella aquatica]|uniref:Type I-E CRISPR-associated protein Cas7/Cse4/CasC n=1 Tax=Silvanigrella aquatica TaxID=1915309 RepID=A0A1L4CXX1_9BACT|nr:type I-E CRISPR-associated protein Cas7/Cse4/CasC [Silvanigrella aquatica]APJ02802.1 type I-E CRISPR-associated protein Cas7/Cse4/CasC [Silvanigrella aquatica]